MLLWIAATTAGLAAAVWLLGYLLLKGPDLARYDQPIDSRVATQPADRDELAALIERIRTTQSRIKSAPFWKWIRLSREWADSGFGQPPVSLEAAGVRVVPLAADGLRGEWILPLETDSSRRRLLYLHGGGFVVGSARGHRAVTVALARATGCAVLAVDYRRMFEYSRRAMIRDCQAAYRYVLEHGPDGQAPADAVFLAGDSAGGNLTLMLLAWARDCGLRQVDAAAAICPGIDMTLSTPSARRNLATDPFLAPAIRPFLNLPRPLFLIFMWIAKGIRPCHPVVSPVFGDLSRLPPLLVQASEAEMVLDDARRYVNKARAAGSPVTLQTWPDMVHVWHLFGPNLPEASEAVERIARFFDEHAPRDAKAAQ